jgi:hypothetical protein
MSHHSATQNAISFQLIFDIEDMTRGAVARRVPFASRLATRVDRDPRQDLLPAARTLSSLLENSWRHQEFWSQPDSLDGRRLAAST